MAYYNKIGLLVLNEDATKFLVCEKYPGNVTSDYIMPGGVLEEPDDITCLQNEIQEELSCELDVSSLIFLSEYTAVAAGRPDRDVSIRLYQGKIIGEPRASMEIMALHWIGQNDVSNERVSSIVQDNIIPDLIARGILK
jgi:hypothetical protein